MILAAISNFNMTWMKHEGDLTREKGDLYGVHEEKAYMTDKDILKVTRHFGSFLSNRQNFLAEKKKT